MMEGLKKRTRKAFGIRKKEKDNDSTGSPDRDGGSQKKTNGAPNGFYGDIDWDRYNSPEVDDEGYSIRPEDEAEEGIASTTKKGHFFSSDESEGEEDHRKKFKIKIKPLPPDRVAIAPSVDELKASIGNIALSPSPLKRSPGLKRNTSSEEIVRPRRVVTTLPSVAPAPAPAPQAPSQQTAVSEDTTALFGPPLETAFGEEKTEAPPPLPPKNVPTSPPTTSPPPLSADEAEMPTEADSSTRKPSIADLDNIFGPDAPAPGDDDAGDSWVCFSEESAGQPPQPTDPAPPLPTSPPPPEEPAPALPASPPLPESPAPPLPTSPPPLEDSPPPLPTSPPPKEDVVPALPTSPPPTEEPSAPPNRSAPGTPDDQNPVTLATSPPPAPKELSSPPASPPPPSDSPAGVTPAPPPKAVTPPAVTPPAEEPVPRSVPPPLLLSKDEEPKNTDATSPKEDGGENVTSPKDANQGSRSTPPLLPPPTYRAVVSSPGPTSGGTNSGSSSPVRPATPSSVNPTPPPPPPRPPSRPKLPPGKPSVGDVNRPFSPPIHSASPPPIAPLARAESTSSISSTNSMSAATTPTVNKELSVSVTGVCDPSAVTWGRYLQAKLCPLI